MVFPHSILDVRTSILLGSWTDITSLTYQRDSPALTITRGRPDETSTANPATLTGSLNNRDGRFSPRNPAGPYYGPLGRNTPVRVSVPAPSVRLRLEDTFSGAASTPSSTALNVTGDIDVRLDIQPSNWGLGEAFGKWGSGGSNQSWLIQLNPSGVLTFFWSTTGANTLSATCSQPVPLGRSVWRVTLAAATNVVTFFTGAAGNANTGPFTQLGSPVDQAGSTSIFASTAPVTVGGPPGFAGVLGDYYEAVIKNGISGTNVARPVFSAQSDGATSFTDAQGNVWTPGGSAELSGRSYLFHGELSSLPVQWDNSGSDVWVPLQAAGLLRRISQGNSPVDSTLKRGVLNDPSGVVAYWPCEDGQGATSIGSALGGPPMLITGTPAFASDTSFLCSNAIPQLSNSAWRGPVPGYTAGNGIVLRFLMHVPNGGEPGNNVRLMRLFTTGTATEVSMYYQTGGFLGLVGLSAGGVLFDSGGVNFQAVGEKLLVSIELQNLTGSTMSWNIATMQVGAASGLSFGSSVLGQSGNAVQVIVAPGAVSSGQAAIGHVWVQSQVDSLFSLSQQLNAWQGESAGDRFARLCGENGISPRIYGYLDQTAPMGPQSPDTLSNLLTECERADLGQMFEPRRALGLGYRTQASLLNQSPAVTLDYPSQQIGDGQATLDPTDDDQYTLNDITVQRGSAATSGSSIQVVLDDGSPMSISNPPVGVGDYSTQVTANLEFDSQLGDSAGWQLHSGTVNEERYPVIPIGMNRSAVAGNSALFFAVQETDLGDYVAITNPPPWLPPDMIKQLVLGTTVMLGGYDYRIAWNTVPESVYETGIFDDPAYGHADTDGSALSAAATSTATTIHVATTGPSGILWTTAAADFPFGIICGGEVMTVTAISGTTSPQAFTVTRSVNGVVKAQLNGADVRLHPTPVFAMI